MKRLRTLGITLVTSIAIATSCNDDFVNTLPLNEFSADIVWSDAPLAEAFVTEIYAGFGNGGFDEQMNASLTDEAIFTHPGRGITTITEGRSNPADIGWVNGTWSWQNMYLRIRAANLALSKLAQPQFPNTNGIVDRLTGEAKFMRAWYYHQLARYYGGVPLIDRPFELGEADYMTPRNTWEETVNFIVKDLDDAARLLEGRNMALGRANRSAALALKARILTYAASDLYDAPTARAKSSVLAGFANPALISYTSGNRTERWQKAKAAAKAVLDGRTGAWTNLTAPVSRAEGSTNYNNIAMSRNGGQNDLIMGRYFIPTKREGGARQGLFNGPNGYNNWAGNTPIQHFIDDYEMMDGTRFDWNNPEHKAAPYDNRDPRFYASVLFDGAQWKPRAPANQPRDPAGQIQTGRYQVISGGNTVTHNGLDTRLSPIEDWNGTYTGYYFRKFIEPNPNFVDQNTWQEVPWPILRYTEAIFHYAEACIALGEEEEARTWLNKIRFRAGMPAITDTGEALRQRFINEKRIEMAYEEQRFFDVRRWMMAPQMFSRKANGITIFGTLKPGKTVTTYKYDKENYNYSYEVFEIDPGKENRIWADKLYFIPIHRDEMNRNTKLVQNPGY